MSLSVSVFIQENKRAWDRFVWQANNGTLFHTRKFLEYHPPDRFEDHSLILSDGERIIALFPAIIKKQAGKLALVSHGGASYGGFVFRETLSVRSAFELVEALIVHCKKFEFDTVDITLPPIIYQKRPSHYIDFALYKNGFTYRKREVSSVIPLDFSAEDTIKMFKPEARTATRRSMKLGIDIQESDDFDSFYPILSKNLAMRHGVQPTHTLEELKELKRRFPHRIRHYGAFLDSRMIAGVTNFICNDQVVLAFYISHDEAFQEYRPVNRLFYEIIRWSIESGMKFLDFGIFTVNEDPNWGLGKFKESFGARGILRETFQRVI